MQAIVDFRNSALWIREPANLALVEAPLPLQNGNVFTNT